MKVALVFPRYKYPSGDCPLGIACLAAVLKRHTDATVDIIDTTFDKSYDRAKRLLVEGDYDIAGFSIMTTMVKDALFLADFLKKEKPECLVVFGGPHATVMPEETLQNACVDAVAIGEGEETFREIVENKGNFAGISGVWHKGPGGPVKNPPRTPIAKLDELPWPSIDSSPQINSYLRYWFQMDSVRTDARGVNILGSRGCPYACTYCQPTLSKLFGGKIRKRSPGNIIAEIRHWKGKLGINSFIFADDTLIFDKDWVVEICDRLIAEKLDVIWGCNARANMITEELFSKMKSAGLRKVFMGIESGSQRVLDEIYEKRITLDQVRKSVEIFNKLGLKAQGYCMLGAPTETEEEIRQTIRFVKQLPIDEVTFSITTPFPHTYLYEKTRDSIARAVEDFDYYKTPVYKGGSVLAPEKLKRLKKTALLSFYLSPRHISYTIKAFITPTAIRKSLIKLKRF